MSYHGNMVISFNLWDPQICLVMSCQLAPNELRQLRIWIPLVKARIWVGFAMFVGLGLVLGFLYICMLVVVCLFGCECVWWLNFVWLLVVEKIWNLEWEREKIWAMGKRKKKKKKKERKKKERFGVGNRANLGCG